MMDRRRKCFLWVLGIAGFGMLDSAWLLAVHLGSSGRGLCTFSAVLNCEAVNASAYSAWFSIPVPVYGLFFYGVAFSLALLGMRGKEREPAAESLGLLGMAAVSALVTLYMAAISFGLLKAFCLFCALLYVASAAFLVAAWKLWTTLEARGWSVILSVGRAVVRKPLFWVVVVSLLGSLELLHGYFGARPKLSGPETFVRAEALRTVGPAEAEVAIAEFSDFQCPFCKVAAMVLQDVAREMGDRVRVTYKFFPLDRSCNPLGGRHRFACAASYAAYCASLQNRFWEYHDLLFSSPEELPAPRLEAFAAYVGLDPGTFAKCMADRKTKQAVEADIREGQELGIQGTPSLFINGRRYTGPITPAAIKEAVAEARSAGASDRRR